MSTEMEALQPSQRRTIFIVPRQHVKTVKTALEEHGKLDRTAKIVPEHHGEASPVSMRIPTTIPWAWTNSSQDDEFITRTNTLSKLGLHQLSKEISFSHHSVSTATVDKNPLRKALREVLSRLPPSILASLNLTPDRLVNAFPEAYSIYPPLLLLPPNAFASPLWKALFTAHPVSAASLQPLWTHIASAMKVQCIAINSPIPLQNGRNMLRSPLNMTPLHGNFGPSPTAQTLSTPTAQDFTNALWVHSHQNHIHQIWAPLYTMFSRGNVCEKTRILNFPAPASPTAAVDMYSGIGYFSFPYLATSHRPVFCFDLNPWSIEGLRRGAHANKISLKIFSPQNLHLWDQETFSPLHDLYVFHLGNESAYPLLSARRNVLPRIGHVNLGLLPDSRRAWRDAVRLLDERGGWIHAHENVGEEEMDDREREVGLVFQGYVDELWEGMGRKAEVAHVEVVKMYAPGVMHCVFDVWVDGITGEEKTLKVGN